MSEHDPSPELVPASRRVPRALARASGCALATLIVAGLVGQVVRDRSVGTALLMYIPLLLVGAVAVLLDLASRGRSIPRLRFGLTGLGAAAIGWSAYSMLGSGIVDEPEPGEMGVSVLQWNVLWGGGIGYRGPGAPQRAAITDRAPDLVVLSEAPPPKWIKLLLGQLGPGAVCVGLQHDPTSSHFYRLAVCSRWPVRVDEHLRLPGGSGMSVQATVRGRHLRLLVVDGISAPTRSRIPFLQAIAQTCRDAEASGRPYDLVLGDFNTPSRSLGFAELEALGYRLAGRSTRGWRGTFPAWLPVFDIDHVWLRRGLRLGSCAFFNGPNTDHRGQLVRVLLPNEEVP